MGPEDSKHPVGEPPGHVRLAPGVLLPEGLLSYSFTTSSGPGGQAVNKKATRAELRVMLAALPIHAQAAERLAKLAGRRLTDAGELIIESDVHRSQARNREECLERLCDLVKQAIVKPKIRRPTKPSKGAKRRRLDDKKHRGDIKRNRGGGGDD